MAMKKISFTIEYLQHLQGKRLRPMFVWILHAYASPFLTVIFVFIPLFFLRKENATAVRKDWQKPEVSWKRQPLWPVVLHNLSAIYLIFFQLLTAQYILWDLQAEYGAHYVDTNISHIDCHNRNCAITVKAFSPLIWTVYQMPAYEVLTVKLAK